MMSLIQMILLSFTIAYGGTNDIHTVGQAVCKMSSSEHRISMRCFGNNPVPCDVIYKHSDDHFKKLKLIIDSKKEVSVCAEQFQKYQKSLQDKGYTCSVSLNPVSSNKNQEAKPEAPVVEKPKAIEPVKPQEVPQAAPPPSAPAEVKAPEPAPKKKVSPNIQTPPPPPSDWVPPKK